MSMRCFRESGRLMLGAMEFISATSVGYGSGKVTRGKRTSKSGFSSTTFILLDKSRGS